MPSGRIGLPLQGGAARSGDGAQDDRGGGVRAIVTGGAGFIGSALVRRLIGDGHAVLNIDKLTYAGRLDTVASVSRDPNYSFLRADVADAMVMTRACAEFGP